MKNLFRYDFFDKNKGVAMAAYAIVCCVFIAARQFNVQLPVAIFGVPMAVVWLLLCLGVLALFAWINRAFGRQALTDKQLRLLNKIGWAIWAVCLIVATYMIF